MPTKEDLIRSIEDHHVCILYNKAQEDKANWLRDRLLHKEYKVITAEDESAQASSLLARSHKVVVIISNDYLRSSRYKEEMEKIKGLTLECREEIFIPVLCNLEYGDLPPELQKGDVVPCIGLTKKYPVVGEETYLKGVVEHIGKRCPLFKKTDDTLGCDIHAGAEHYRKANKGSCGWSDNTSDESQKKTDFKAEMTTNVEDDLGEESDSPVDLHGRSISASQSCPTLALDAQYLSNYTNIRTIGSGQFGTVDKAKHKVDGREYAVKWMPVKDWEKMRIEPVVCAMMDHPNVVKYQFSWLAGSDQPAEEGEGTGRLYMSMELCRDDNLAEWLLNNPLKRGYTAQIERVEMFIQICKGVTYIHSRGFVHRDLKPRNILFSLDGHLLKIADFGLVETEKVCGEDQTIGSKNPTRKHESSFYQGLERRTGGKGTKSGDIYALGAIFVEMTLSLCSNNERIEKLTKLRDDGHFLKDYKKQNQIEGRFVANLLARDPKDRPTADMIIPLIPRLIRRGQTLTRSQSFTGI